MTEATFIEGRESKIYPSIGVRYEGELTPETALFKIDGELLAKAIRESDYSGIVISNVVISDKVGTGEIAHMNSYTNQAVIYHDQLVATLRRFRQAEHEGLDALPENSNKFKNFLNAVGYLLNPFTAPYKLLADKGRYMHVYSGNIDRRNRYRDQAQEGFEVKRGGETVKMSRAESVHRAKQFFDRLLERATPGIIGWVVAHEFEHNHNHGKKLAIKVGSLFGPVLGVGAAAQAAGVPELMGTGVILGWVGAVLGRTADEKASYNAGDKNFAKFAKAISINHEVFKTKVLGDLPPVA